MKINFNLIFSEEIVHGLQFLLFYYSVVSYFKYFRKTENLRFLGFMKKGEVILTIFRLW